MICSVLTFITCNSSQEPGTAQTQELLLDHTSLKALLTTPPVLAWCSWSEVLHFGLLIGSSLMLISVILKVIHKQYILIIPSISFSLTVGGCLYIGSNSFWVFLCLAITHERKTDFNHISFQYIQFQWRNVIGPAAVGDPPLSGSTAQNTTIGLPWVKYLFPDLQYVTNGERHGGKRSIQEQKQGVWHVMTQILTYTLTLCSWHY